MKMKFAGHMNKMAATPIRHSEFRFFPVPDGFINRQTVLFYEKRIFIDPKNGTFYLSN